MLTYLFTASILLFVFAFGCYLFLRQGPAFALRRRVLLLGVTGVLLLPLCPAPTIPQVVPEQISVTDAVREWEVNNLEITESFIAVSDVPSDNGTTKMMVSRVFSPKGALILGYLLIALLFLGRLLIGVARLFRIHRRSSASAAPDVRIIAGRGEAFTFGRTVYVSESVYDSPDFAVILAHERAHAEQWHTFDALLLEVFRAVFWFHPMAWWTRRQVQLNLEYLADAAVLRAGYDRRAYQLSLVAHQHGTDFRTSLLPQFAAKGLKRRIKMMSFRAGPQVRSLVAVGGLIFMGFVAFACTTGEAETKASNTSSPENPLLTQLTAPIDGAVELNVYFKRLPTPEELAIVRQPLRKYFDRDLFVYQSCEDQAGIFTFAATDKDRGFNSIAKLTTDEFSPQPRRLQYNRNGKGGRGSATFRPQPLPEDAPDEDILINLNGTWVPIAAEDKTPFNQSNLAEKPISEQVKCQLGLTPENKTGFNVGTSTYGSSKSINAKEGIVAVDDAAAGTDININKAYFYGNEEIDFATFTKRADEPNHTLTIAKRVGDTEIYTVLRLDKMAGRG